MTGANGDNDHRKPPAPHCYRVVQLGLNLGADMAPALAERTSGAIVRRGKRIDGCTIFEPKVGGGGHLLLMEDDAAGPWARVLVEPDGDCLNLVAAILDGEWDASDETLVSQVRDWLRSLHGITAAAEPNNSTMHSADSGTQPQVR